MVSMLSAIAALGLLPLGVHPIEIAAPPPPSRVILHAPWGSARGAFAKEDDGARLGPSALVATDAKLYLLDRVNARVQVFDLAGKLLEVLPAGTCSIDLLAVDGRGAALVLDAFVRREVRILRAGAEPEVLSLPAHGRDLPSEIFAGRDAVLIEWQHGPVSAVHHAGLAPLLDLPSARVDGAELGGRPAVFGWVRARRSRLGLHLELGRRGGARQGIDLAIGGGVEAILALGSDAAGHILVAAWPRSDPRRRPLVALFSARGKLLARFAIPDGTITDIYTRLYLAPGGRLYQLRTDQGGVEVREWLWRAAIPKSLLPARGGVR